MIISIISDTHFGFGQGTEKENDSYEHFEEALDKSMREADLIIVPGDIFDSRTPKQEVFDRVFKLFQKAREFPPSSAKLVEKIKKEEINPDTLKGIPIVAIHGTHEKRSEGNINPVQLMERAGYLIHLDGQALVFQKGEEKVAIHGMSGVPEQYAPEKVKEDEYKVVWGAKNIFVFHQSIGDFIPGIVECMDTTDLPPGFDLYIDGHIHFPRYVEKDKLLIAGSTIVTQQKPEETKAKGYYMLDTSDMSLEFREIKNQRAFLYGELSFDNESTTNIIEKTREKLSSMLKEEFNKKPLVRVKLKGSIEGNRNANRISVSEITKGFEEKAIISIAKDFDSEDLAGTMKSLHEKHMQKMSVDELGVQVINEQLAKKNYKGLPTSRILDLLAEGKGEEILKIIDTNFEEKFKKKQEFLTYDNERL